MSIFLPQNPGIGGLKELTNGEAVFLSSFAGLPYIQDDVLIYKSGVLTNVNHPFIYLTGDNMTGDLIGTDFVSTRSGTITRVGGYLSKVVKTGGRILNITRNTSNKISSITDGIRTWNFTRTSGVITSWNVV